MVISTSHREAEETADGLPQTNEIRRFLRVFLGRKVVIFGAVVILMLIVVALLLPSSFLTIPINRI